MRDRYRNFIADDPWKNCCSGMMIGADGSVDTNLPVKQDKWIPISTLVVMAGFVAVIGYAMSKIFK